MRPLSLLLVPVWLAISASAATPRFARLSEFEGQVDTQLHPADAWTPAQLNLPLPELSWVRTGDAARVEIESDEGSAWRLGPGSLGEISDYTRLSTGQRITLFSLDRGLAYFTGEPEGKDALMLAVPGAEITLRLGSRIRLEVQDAWSQIAVIEGMVRFSSPAAELDLHQGQTVRVEPANPARFFLYREVTPRDLDRWSEDRDKRLAAPVSARHVLQRYGLVELDENGEWIQTEDLGTVWKPKTPEGWTPYRSGRWLWYDSLGYTWVSNDPWGWLTDHYGRWLQREGTGWLWIPSQSTVFHPGDVYWLQGPKFAGWGSLAPGEDWTPATRPQQFLNANTTYAQFRAGARAIDPAGFQDRPKDPLGAAVFALALPSPAFPTARLEAVRPILRVGSTRVVPVVPGAAYQDGPISGVGQSPDDSPVSVLTNPGSSDPPLVVVTQPPPDLPPLQPPQSPDVYYPAPVYTGIIVVNPPERPDGPTYRRPNPSQPPKNPIAQNPPTTPAPQPGQPAPAPGQPAAPGKPPEPVSGGNPPPRHPEPRPKPLPEPPARPAPAPAPPPPAAPVTAKPTPAPAPAPASPPPSTETKVAPPSPVKN